MKAFAHLPHFRPTSAQGQEIPTCPSAPPLYGGKSRWAEWLKNRSPVGCFCPQIRTEGKGSPTMKPRRYLFRHQFFTGDQGR